MGANEQTYRLYNCGLCAVQVRICRNCDHGNQVFPNAACVSTLIDRLVHRAEIVGLEGESYRLKEAKERTDRKAKTRNSTARKKS